MVNMILQELLEMSKVEYSEMEKQLRSDTALMEKKYRKAKKLIREYQHRYYIAHLLIACFLMSTSAKNYQNQFNFMYNEVLASQRRDIF